MNETTSLAQHMLIICGPSGVGKSTLLKHLLVQRQTCVLSRSTTTRAPRGKEQDGVEYDFVDIPTFETRIAAGFFAEHALVFGNYYGTPHSMIRDNALASIDILFDIDVQGARQLKEQYPQAWCVLIAPPSMDELAQRLQNRKTEPPEVVSLRLAQAQTELSQKDLFDFVLVNSVLPEAKHHLLSIYDALRLRSAR